MKKGFIVKKVPEPKFFSEFSRQKQHVSYRRQAQSGKDSIDLIFEEE